MTRKSKREIERALDHLESDDAAEGNISPITVRHIGVDENGDVVGVRRESTFGCDDAGEWDVDRETFDVPNDRLGGSA
jgi:hypothetical protein